MGGNAMSHRRRKQCRDPDREQVETRICSAEEIVGNPYFAIGAADFRAGVAPRFDEMEDNTSWAYERGRLWAVIAPRTMNPQSSLAARLLEAAWERRWII
jgi:hypothetical protein